jgi:hypothetical protein
MDMVDNSGGLSVRAKRFRALFMLLGVAFATIAVLLAVMWNTDNTQREQTAFANAKEPPAPPQP